MLGTLIALIYVACVMLFSEAAVIPTVHGACTFLWYWHLVFAVIFGIVMAVIPLFCACAGSAACGVKDRPFGPRGKTISGAGIVGGGIAGAGVGLGIALILAILWAMTSGLYLGGTYAVWHATDGAETFDMVNMRWFVTGCVMYGMALLVTLINRCRASASKSD